MWSYIKMLAAVAFVLVVAGYVQQCQVTDTDTYRYKLTVAVNTPDGVKQDASVVGVWGGCSHLGCQHSLTGEALYVDLGAGRRPLVVPITPNYKPFGELTGNAHWHEGGPGFVLEKLYRTRGNGKLGDGPLNEPHPIDPSELPNLLTFSDANNPDSVIAVDWRNLGASLGVGISWNSVTIELTHEPITTGILQKLPWLADPRSFWGALSKDTRFWLVSFVGPDGTVSHSPGLVDFVNVKTFISKD
jgi:hypothetical protein